MIVGLYASDKEAKNKNSYLKEFSENIKKYGCDIGFWWSAKPEDEVLKQLNELIKKIGYFYFYMFYSHKAIALLKIEDFYVLEDPYNDDLPESWKNCGNAELWFNKEKRRKLIDKEKDNKKPKIIFKVKEIIFLDENKKTKFEGNPNPKWIGQDMDLIKFINEFKDEKKVSNEINKLKSIFLQETCLKKLKLDEHIKFSFYNSLKTKGFVILAGLSGTGKTKIFEEFVKCFPSIYKQRLKNVLIQEKEKIKKENVDYLERLLKEFQEKYNKDFLKNMKLQDWHDTKKGLVYEIEHGKFRDLGGIVGATADKFGVYKSTSNKCTPNSIAFNGYCFRKSLGQSLQEAFENLKSDLIKLYQFAINEDLESIENEIHAVSNLVKRKLAFLWNPNLIFNIYSDNHIKLIVQSFGENCKDFIDCQKALDKIKQKFFSELDKLSFTKLLYEYSIKNLWENGMLLIESKKISNDLFFPIRPDFKDTKSLLGFYNPLKEQYHSTPLLNFVLEASKNYLERGKEADPFFVLFDEMNLARVEYYFADFLSVLETKRFETKDEAVNNERFANFLDGMGRNASEINENNYKFSSQSIKLHSEDRDLKDKHGNIIPQELFLSPNLYFVGTVNIDETTHMFSPKVLDRAFTIEFDAGSFDEYLEFLNKAVENVDLADEIKQQLKQDFVNNGEFAVINKNKIKEFSTNNKDIIEKLENINKVLRRYDLHFGYRVFDEIIMFLYNCQNSQLKFEKSDEALDLAIKMKVLPKFHGTRQRLEKPIIEFLRILELNPESKEKQDNENKPSSINLIDELSQKIQEVPIIYGKILKVSLGEREIKVKTPYPHTVQKLLQMLYKLKTQGFTSFM